MNKDYNKQFISECCEAKVYTLRDQTTKTYICDKCNQPCEILNAENGLRESGAIKYAIFNL